MVLSHGILEFNFYKDLTSYGILSITIGTILNDQSSHYFVT